MIFRLHSIVALIGATLLLPVTGRAQQAAQPAAPATGQSAAPAEQIEKTPEAPIEPVMSGPYPVMSKAAQDRARQIFEMFNHGDFSAMWTAVSDGLKKASGKEERFLEVNKKYREAMGAETSMKEENMVPYLFSPDTVYSRLSNFSKVSRPITFTITINQRGLIDAFDIKVLPEIIPEGQYAGYEDKAKLKLPFGDEWLVYQGGRSVFENPYATSDDQRFGLDFAYLKNGRLFSGVGGGGSKNADYYCFGQPILAPADGTVVKAEAGYDDNPPGRPSGDPADGNIIVISHGEGESSMMNHLKQNSLKVKRGDKVKAGDVIGECGNSGAGPVPHLHYQFQRASGVPLPAQFVDYIADGKPVASGEPVRGQLVKNGLATQAGAIGTSSGKASITTSSPAAGSAGKTPPTQNQSH